MLPAPISIRVDAPSIRERRSDRPEFWLVGDVLEPPRAGRHSKVNVDDSTELVDIGTFERRRVHPHRSSTVFFNSCRTQPMRDLFYYGLYLA